VPSLYRHDRPFENAISKSLNILTESAPISEITGETYRMLLH